MVHSMKMGWMKPPSQVQKELEEKSQEVEKFYDLWSNEEEVRPGPECLGFCPLLIDPGSLDKTLPFITHLDNNAVY